MNNARFIHSNEIDGEFRDKKKGLHAVFYQFKKICQWSENKYEKKMCSQSVYICD